MQINAPILPGFEAILTRPALELVARLHRDFDARRRQLLAYRHARASKLEAGERPEETLIRELEEELSIVVKEACLAPLTFASHSYPEFHLLMPLYVCRRWEGTVMPKEGQQLAWVRPNRLREYPMPEADIPLIPHLTALV